MPPKTVFDPRSDDLDTEIALFRYGLIAQLIHDPPASGHREALLREIAAKSYRIPSSTCTIQVSTTTLRRRFASRPTALAASMPCARSPAPTPAHRGPFRRRCWRVRSPCTRSSRHAPRRPWPTSCSTTRACIWSGPSMSTPSPPSCAAWARRAACSHQRVTAYRRFEREHVNSLWQGDAFLVGPLRLRSGQALAAGSGPTRQEAPRPSVLLHPHLTVGQVSTTTAGWCLTASSSSTKRCRVWSVC